jgi:hypothetical protein
MPPKGGIFVCSFLVANVLSTPMKLNHFFNDGIYDGIVKNSDARK